MPAIPRTVSEVVFFLAGLVCSVCSGAFLPSHNHGGALTFALLAIGFWIQSAAYKVIP